jgi:hypothetical protein
MADTLTICLDTEVDAVKTNDTAHGRDFVKLYGPFTSNELFVVCMLDTPGDTDVSLISRAGNKVGVLSRPKPAG